MKSWNNAQARRDATWDFCHRMRQSPEDRAKCKRDREFAKRTFAKGWFYLEGDEQADPNNLLAAIPKSVEFRVYDFTPLAARDDLVTLVLPPDTAPLPLPSRATDPLEDVWRCTWSVYVS